MTTYPASRQADLLRWRARYTDAAPIGSAQPRQRATVVGVVAAIRLVPGRSLEAEIEDGTGRLTVVWAGRSRVNGLELGTGLKVTGTVAREQQRRTMRNPEWALVGEPYA